VLINNKGQASRYCLPFVVSDLFSVILNRITKQKELPDKTAKKTAA
jgi:hypothetical protein